MNRILQGLLIVFGFALAANAQRYNQVAIPDLGNGVDQYQVNGMNNAGQVVGWSSLPNPYPIHGFMWSKATGTIDMGTLPGGTSSSAFSVNASGTAVGMADAADGKQHGFIWSPKSGIQDIGTLGDYLVANLISDNGSVAGTYNTNNVSHTFRWTAATGMQDLGFGDNSEPVGINASGQIVGIQYSGPCAGFGHSVLWSPSTGLQSLDYPGAVCTRVSAINNSGQVAGEFDPLTAGVNTTGFLWSPKSGFQTLPTLGGSYTHPYFTNSRGDVAGASATAGGQYHEFFWNAASGMVDAGAPANDFYSSPYALNNKGEVYGCGLTKTSPPTGLQCFDWFANAGLHTIALQAGPLNDAGQIAGGRTVAGKRINYLFTPRMTVTVASSLNPSKSGQSVTISAKITSIVGGPPDGELITFAQGNTVLAKAPLKSGVASFTTSALTVGSHTITATYAGDANYDPAKASRAQTVTK